MLIQIDLALISWVLFLNCLGYWLGKTRAKEWGVPLTVPLFVVAYLIALISGIMTSRSMGFFKLIAFYVIPNGTIIALLATELYDVVHGIVKKSDLWHNLFHKVYKDREVYND